MKHITLALSGLLLLTIQKPVQAQYEGLVTKEGLIIQSYFGTAGSVTIPTNYTGFTVIGIAANAFQIDFDLTNVVIPATVTNVAEGAFAGCQKLTAISVVPQNPAYSSTNGVLFDYNQTTLIDYPEGLAGSYTVPGSVTNISAEAFLNAGLATVTISGSVQDVGASAFLGCGYLTNVTLQTGLLSVGSGAFGDTSVASVTLPASVTNIGAAAFSPCPELTSIAMAAPNAFYSSSNGVLFNSDQTALVQYPDGLEGSYQIPASVVNIDPNAFANSVVTNVMIPCGVTSIGEQAFQESDVTSVVIPGSVTNIAEGAFAECLKLPAFTVALTNAFYSSPHGVLFDADQTILVQYPGGMGGSYIIPNSVTTIGDYAFETCLSLTNVTIPNGVSSIGYAAFDGSGITTVTIPGSVTNIAEYAFSSQDLTNAIIAAGVTSIGQSAFFGSGLRNVTIPETVTNIGLFAFVDCNQLTGVYFTGEAPATDPSAFAGDSVTAYYLPGTTGWSAFSASTDLVPVLWNPTVQTGAENFGVTSGQFGFNIIGTSNIPISIQACTNLANPAWSSLTNVSLTNSSIYFTEPLQTNSSSRFYRIVPP